MLIKHTNLSEGVHNFEFEKEFHKIGLEEPFYGKVKLKTRLDKSHSQIVVDNKIYLTANLTCDRCGKKFKAELDNEFQLIFFFDEERVKEDDVNVKYLPPEQDSIDLSEDVYDYSMLAVPLKILCDENCTNTSKYMVDNKDESEKIDPVWEPLLKLKNNLKN
jgi:uncharacterized metal-binding protein YceD (DUF177 family)